MDINKVKEELEKFSKNQDSNENKEDGLVFKPQFGDQILRIVPYMFDKTNPFIKLYFHYGLMGKNYLSPVSFDEADPIVEFSNKLKSSGNRDDFALGKKLEPKLRVYAPVLVRGKEKEGVKFWGFSKTMYKDLLQIISDPDYGDITDPKNGRDITVTKIPKEQSNTNYPEIKFVVKPNQKPMTTDSEVVDMVKNQKNIRDVFYVPDYDKLKNALKEWINQNQEDDKNTSSENEVSTDNTEPKSTPNTEFDDLLEGNDNNKDDNVNTSTANDAVSQFDSLFNE